MPTPSKPTPSGRVQRSLDSQVLSTPLGSVYIVLYWAGGVSLYLFGGMGNQLDQLDPFGVAGHKRFLGDDFAGGFRRHGNGGIGGGVCVIGTGDSVGCGGFEALRMTYLA